MSTGKLNGLMVERAAVTLPRWGVWTADVQVASGDLQASAATLELAGLTLVGTVLPDRGNVYRERGFYKIVGGAGGWRRTVPPRAYRNGPGVKLSTVVKDAAREAGETLSTFTDRVVGPSFVRPRGDAGRVLDLLAPQRWHVGEDGVTRLAVRAAAPFGEPYQVMDRRPDRAMLTVAAESIVGLVPGATLEGIEAATVRHELTPAGLRTHIAAYVAGMGDKLLGALGRVVRALTRRAFFLGQYEYRVDGGASGYVDLSPVGASIGLPHLANVAMRSGMPGGSGDPATGTTVLVGFINGDPGRPFVCGFEGASGDAAVPTTARVDASAGVELGNATGRVVRYGDAVNLVGFTSPAGAVVPLTGDFGTIQMATSLSTPAPIIAPGPAGYSKVEA